jgi:hypothetical protein
MLIRLVVLGGLIIALTGREGTPAGDPGGELAMARSNPFLRQNTLLRSSEGVEELVGLRSRSLINRRVGLRSQRGCHVAESRVNRVKGSRGLRISPFPATPSQI